MSDLVSWRHVVGICAQTARLVSLHVCQYCFRTRAGGYLRLRGVLKMALPSSLSHEGKIMAANDKRWVANMKTDSTRPRSGLFTKSPSTIARELASKKVSPKGPQSGMSMLNYFINRAGRGPSPSRRAKLETAKSLLSKRIRQSRTGSRARRKSFKGRKVSSKG